ncbi:type II toxin-antitoxin system prevent-host-death family antitoxin [Vibrio furnissii]|uniref:type II toxin-antitoxin system prevent-host-death family antitoxin n=1 Tax=Vibrio furnissii TaxID=29494 RepID=UPI003B975B72
MELSETTLEIPLARFHKELNSILKRCSRGKMKIVITRNGQPKFVLIDHTTSDEIQAFVKNHTRS